MFAAVDVQYAERVATAACVQFRSWTDDVATEEHVHAASTFEEYIPGEFWRRELPLLAGLLAKLPHAPEVMVIDGYVYLDETKRPGLGAHLHQHLSGHVPVVGVAKRSFQGSPHAVHLLRGKSRQPLFVTAEGVDPALAAEWIAAMHGAHRIPTLLKRVDRLAREGLER